MTPKTTTKTVLKQQTSHGNKSGWRKYLSLHKQAFSTSLKRLSHMPFANIMTISVIGIALALPLALFVVLQNIQILTHGWDDSAQISLFLKMDVKNDQAQLLLQQIQTNPGVASTSYISPEQGLNDFEKQSGFGDVLRQLNNNPLPGVIIVRPTAQMQSPTTIKSLMLELQRFPQVDTAQLDMQWIKRLNAFVNLATQGATALALLLAIAVIMIVGNTIRLATQNYRDEIQVIKLVGATNSFIRRPFLYTGIIYGFIGAFIAYFLVDSLLLWMNPTVNKLTALYDSHFSLAELPFSSIGILYVIGMLLGLIGSWLAVGRQLDAIEPE